MDIVLCHHCIKLCAEPVQFAGLSFAGLDGRRHIATSGWALYQVVKRGQADPDGWEDANQSRVGVYAVTVVNGTALCIVHAAAARS